MLYFTKEEAIAAAREQLQQSSFDRILIIKSRATKNYFLKRPPFNGTEKPVAVVWRDGGVDYCS